MAEKILVVDDDELMQQSLAFHLQKADYEVITAGSAETAFDMARTSPPRLVLLDINMPGMDGLQALRYFRDELNVPVIFISARRREIDEIVGLEMGANDYITKPFDKDVLLARVRATLRQTRPASPPAAQKTPLVLGDLIIDPTSHTVAIAGASIDLAPREFRLLHTLALDAGRVFSVDELLDQVWGEQFFGEPQLVYVQVRSLREKIETDPGRPSRLLTVRGVGYKLMAKALSDSSAVQE